MPDKQMRSVPPRYPVDRYLVESSKKIEMVNIIDDDIWNAEPALRPEDEIILRKLHEMLQSTADDLKLLSGELTKFHESGVQVKTTPTPLDEEFNEKVHIEEVVNAKFHGYKIINKSQSVPEYKPKNDLSKLVVDNKQKLKCSNISMSDKAAPILKRPIINRNLGISRTRIVQINENKNIENERLNNGKIINSAPTVAYNEFSYKYVEPKIKASPKKVFQVQEMPSINIRSELKEQKVLLIDILPESKDNKEINTRKNNIAVISLQHETLLNHVKEIPSERHNSVQYHQLDSKPSIRKVSKMSTCESSGSTVNVSSEAQVQIKPQRRILITTKPSPKISTRFDRSRKSIIKKEAEKQPQLNLDDWKKKLDVVYGPSNSKKNNIPGKSNNSVEKKLSPKKTKSQKNFNNTEYIPYSQLTLGGVRVSDIEKEISDIPHKNDIPLSPILDKILSSRENSFIKTKKCKQKNSPRILTTSDENLLQEVIDIEKTVSETLSKNLKVNSRDPSSKLHSISSDTNEDNDSYVDDFEDDKSDHSKLSENQKQCSDKQSDDQNSNKSSYRDDSIKSDDIDNNKLDPEAMQDTTYTKVSNLSFKNTVDIFEFVHSVDTQDIAIQSNTSLKFPNETQTSPKTDRPSIQPIHNELWPPIDPKGELEKMFKLEKEFIKNLIIEEYGDLLEKDITKPSTSKGDVKDKIKNITVLQKNTQTSPAHVKSIMTSPTRTKTRTTSPFLLSLKVDHQTSPMIFVTEEQQVEVDINNETEDLGISINLSSPRFSLRLPQTSQDVISNLDNNSTANKFNLKEEFKPKYINKFASSSSSLDADNSSSEISSLGELKFKLRRKLKKNRITSISESSSSSTISRFSSDMLSGSILPLRSEGEVSLGQRTKKNSNKASKSEGEMSYGLK